MIKRNSLCEFLFCNNFTMISLSFPFILLLVDDFVKAMGRLAEEDVDIFLGNHMEHSETPQKYEELLKGNEKAFVKKGEFAEFCIKVQGHVQRLIEKEKTDVTD